MFFFSVRNCLICLLTICSCGPVFAQSNQPAFVFEDPPGWERYFTNGLYMLTSTSEAGLLLVWPNDAYIDQATILQELSKPYRDASTLLTPSGSPEVFSQYAMGTVVSGQLIGTPCRGYLVGFRLPDGGGGNILVAANPGVQSPARARALALTLLQSVRGSKSPEADAAPTGIGPNTLGGTGGAAELVAGYRIASISSGGGYDGGYRSREIIHFCSSGLLRVETESSFYVSGGYGSAASEDVDSALGYWKLEGSGNDFVLTLMVNGQTSRESLRIIRYGEDEIRFALKDQYYGYYGAADCH